jgi:hypothetical protein
MGGGLMQLVAYGAQDIYLSGNPQISFFKVVYRRCTNFSMESIEQTFNGSVSFDKKATCTISRNGDLVSSMYIQVELDDLPESLTDIEVVKLGIITAPGSYCFLEDNMSYDSISSTLTSDGQRKIQEQISSTTTIYIELGIELVELGSSVNLTLPDLSLIFDADITFSIDNDSRIFGLMTEIQVVLTTNVVVVTYGFIFERIQIRTSISWEDYTLNELIEEIKDEIIILLGGTPNNTHPYIHSPTEDVTLIVEKNGIIKYGGYIVKDVVLLDGMFVTKDWFDTILVTEYEQPTSTTMLPVDVTTDQLSKDSITDNMLFGIYTVLHFIDQTPVNVSSFSFPQQEWIGHKLIEYIEVEIGGQRIDRHYGDWLGIWNELTQQEGHWSAYKQMVEGNTLYIPLQFWFNRNPGLALPLIALQYHEVKLNIKFAPKSAVYNNLVTNNNGIPYHIQPSELQNYGDIKTASLYVDYIYLDTDERRRFAQVPHEYLVEQLQFIGDQGVSSKITLNFNHPVKELVWVEKKTDGTYNTTYKTANIQLNGHERFSARKPEYFQLVQPYQHHTRVPVGKNINMYSFSLKPEEHQPSGTCNMSRIDNATLNLDGIDTKTSSVIQVFAVNYNVLRIMSGMGGLAYSN